MNENSDLSKSTFYSLSHKRCAVSVSNIVLRDTALSANYFKTQDGHIRRSKPWENPELDGNEVKPSELEGARVHESESPPRVHEVSTSDRPVEMEG